MSKTTDDRRAEIWRRLPDALEGDPIEWRRVLHMDVPWLLAELERVEQQRDRAREAVGVLLDQLADTGIDTTQHPARRVLDGEDAERCTHRNRARIGPHGDGVWVCNDCGYRNDRESDDAT